MNVFPLTLLYDCSLSKLEIDNLLPALTRTGMNWSQ